MEPMYDYQDFLDLEETFQSREKKNDKNKKGSDSDDDKHWIQWTPDKLIKISDFKIAQQMQMIASLMKEQGFINDDSY